MNRFFMVPLYRMGLGPLFGNPLTGYMMVLKTIGRTSGKTRYVPVNYALEKGSIYCLAGWGKAAHWYRNLEADPHAEILLAGGSHYGEVELVSDATERMRIGRKVLQAAGFVGFLMGVNPYRSSDAKINSVLEQELLLRFRVTGVGSGAFDPGGWAWVWAWAWGAAAIIFLILLGINAR
jgi:deazaflavin-dependent oxidoreductase (nitroreductase family)